MTDEIIARVDGSAGILTLNRPRAIHALTLGMCEAMIAALQGWAGDDTIAAVMLDHAEGSRGLCAGGDVTLLRHSAMTDSGESGRHFFAVEYHLNHLMFEYAKPIVAFMDGIVMGGGVGIACPARYRVATEITRLAMPETAIGLFPDVGGGWYLPRLPGRLGQYIGTTGARLDGAECVWAGLATHYLPSAALPQAKARIVAGEVIADVLGTLSAEPPRPAIKERSAAIDRHFAADRLEDILASLSGDDSDWAQATLAILRKHSPQASKVTLRHLAQAARMPTFADEMAIEYRVASRLLTLPDFVEGVRALLIDKTNDPCWTPATPEAVSDAALDAIFAPLAADDEWRPIA